MSMSESFCILESFRRTSCALNSSSYPTATRIFIRASFCFLPSQSSQPCRKILSARGLYGRDLDAQLEPYRRSPVMLKPPRHRAFEDRGFMSSFRFAHLISPPASPASGLIHYPDNEGAFPSRCE